jgi:site-specific DNA-cytosine methylase
MVRSFAESIFSREESSCPPFSIAGKQLGHEDERDLFPEALRLIAEPRPAVVQLESVPMCARTQQMVGVCVKVSPKQLG